jgi:hypothetical protein
MDMQACVYTRMFACTCTLTYDIFMCVGFNTYNIVSKGMEN